LCCKLQCLCSVVSSYDNAYWPKKVGYLRITVPQSFEEFHKLRHRIWKNFPWKKRRPAKWHHRVSNLPSQLATKSPTLLNLTSLALAVLSNTYVEAATCKWHNNRSHVYAVAKYMVSYSCTLNRTASAPVALADSMTVVHPQHLFDFHMNHRQLQVTEILCLVCKAQLSQWCRKLSGLQVTVTQINVKAWSALCYDTNKGCMHCRSHVICMLLHFIH